MKKLPVLLVSVAALALASCGGGGDGTITDPGSGGGGGGGGGGTLNVELGSGAPGAFSAGVIAVAVPTLSAGGSTSLSVSLVQADNTYFTEATDITFSSGCIANGLATVTPNPASTSTGAATVTYAATGCSGDDVVTATASANGENLTATGAVSVAAAAVGSIQFVSATPTNIGLKGTGGAGLSETSTVVFKVVDSTGGPVAGATVSFVADTSVGGLFILPSSGTSGANGEVQTVVNSGTVATSVRVTATVTSVTPNIATQSSQLVITTGLPDQDSFSMAVQCPNVEAYDYDGVKNPVTVRLADRFNNPVPDGTAVTLNAEGGQIAGSCTTTTSGTESGVCSVDWVSSNPRPADGRVTLLATAIGEESFVDGNGDGVFGGAPDTFTDLAEPFRNDDESVDGGGNPTYSVGEFFLDYFDDGVRTAGDGLFNGLLCQPGPGSGSCASGDKLGISASNIIIMSGSTAAITDNVGGTLAAPGTVTFSISDLRGQPMPSGTTVKIEVTNGKTLGPTSYTMPCTTVNGAVNFSFTIDADNTSSAGLLFLTVETPKKIVTPYVINITD